MLPNNKKIFVLKSVKNGTEKAFRQILKKASNLKDVEVTERELDLKKAKELFKKADAIICTSVSKELEKLAITIPVFSHQNEIKYLKGKHQDPIFIFNGIAEEIERILIKYEIKKKPKEVKIQHEKIASKFEKVKESLKVEEYEVGKEDCKVCVFLQSEEYVHKNRNIFETKNFVVQASVGALLPGYLVILPKRHVVSIARLNKEEQLEFKVLMKSVRELLKAIYGVEPILWENGMKNTEANKIINLRLHATIHMCPIEIDIYNELRKIGFDLEFCEYEDISKYADTQYVFVLNNKGDTQILDTQDLFFSIHTIRKLICGKINLPEEAWDMRKFKFYENIDYTRKHISEILNFYGAEKYFSEILGKYEFTINSNIYKF